MCMLCGALGMGRHWAEKGRDDPARRQERRLRIRLLNRILAHHGAEASLWGRGYLLRRDGVAHRAENLGDLWIQVERAGGGRCDPLDPSLIAALDRAATPAP